MRRYLASFCPAISRHGTEQYVSVDGKLRTSVEVEEAALEVCLALQKVASPASRVVIATDDALWVSVFLLAVWHANMEPVFASSLEARDILAVPKAQVVLTTDVEEVAHKSYLDLKAHGLQLLGSQCAEQRHLSCGNRKGRCTRHRKEYCGGGHGV